MIGPPLGPNRLREYELEQKIRHGDDKEPLDTPQYRKLKRRATILYTIVLLVTAGVVCWIIFA